MKKSHGFGRISEWEVDESKSTQGTGNGSVHVVFTLSSSEATMKMWPYQFKCEYTVSLSQAGNLRMFVKVFNLDNKDISFTTGLHTYYHVKDITKTSVVLSADETIRFKEEVDKKWVGTEPSISIIDEGYMRAIEIKKTNFNDVCIWNPWEEACKKFSDLHDYKTFLCVEPIQIDPAVVVKPDGVWEGDVDHKVTYCPV